MSVGTVHEVRFTSSQEWLAEWQRDHEAGQVQDRIVRISCMTGPGTVAMLYPERAGDHRLLAERIKAHYVEASYVSSRDQLVKLSIYIGLSGVDAEEPTLLREQETLRSLQRQLNNIADLRGGGLFVEDGPWKASPVEEIAAPAGVSCASCDLPIYFANEQWRHRELDVEEWLTLERPAGVDIQVGQAEAFVAELCPVCEGSGTVRGRLCGACHGTKHLKTLHHLADPKERGRLV